MKVFIVLLICIFAAFGECISNQQIDEMLRDASNACVRELNRDPRFLLNKGPPKNPCLVDDPVFVICLEKKMAVMNEDGSYNLERILSFTDTKEAKQRIESIFNTKIKDCASKTGNDLCKMVACVHKLTESSCTIRLSDEENECFSLKKPGK